MQVSHRHGYIEYICACIVAHCPHAVPLHWINWVNQMSMKHSAANI